MVKPLNSSDDHFRSFAVALENEIAKYDDGNSSAEQKQQIEALIDAEDRFRQELIKTVRGQRVYRYFVRYIRDTKKNILDARPYFRERQTVFADEISTALKARNEVDLYKFHINFQFVQFALNCLQSKPNSKLGKIAQEIAQLRTKLVVKNMPLGVSRARIFWSRTPQSQLAFMDLVQISCDGLMSAIDKFVLPYTPVFRSVAIGRMGGNFIEQYSETFLHFFPTDKRKIYRANKIMSKNTDMDYEGLAAAVNDGIAPQCQTSAVELAGLMGAASCVSLNKKKTTPKDGQPAITIESFAAPEDERPDVMIEEKEAFEQMQGAMAKLSVFDRKFLRLMGVAIK